MAVRDLALEALAGIVQRPGRSVLTMLGTVLGVGAFVSVLGLTATASGQIGRQFDALKATTVTVTAPEDPAESKAGGRLLFPDDAEQRVTRLNGVTSAGVWWPVQLSGPPLITGSQRTRAGSVADAGGMAQLFAASPGTLRAIRPDIAGVAFNGSHDRRKAAVAVIGESVADRLGIGRLDTAPAIFINHRAFAVIGIVRNSEQLPEMLSGVIIPSGTVLDLYGPPMNKAGPQMLIRTKVGAAQLIARQAPLALRPDRPEALIALPPPDPRSLRENVDTSLAGLFLALAAICLVIGAIGIANTTFVAVLERTPEIGLRRALGARPRHIAAQCLSESTALGLLGGMIGTCAAVMVVLVVAVARDWTSVLDPFVVLPAPLIGAVAGLLAGLYPALRAAHIEPLEALRH